MAAIGLQLGTENKAERFSGSNCLRHAFTGRCETLEGNDRRPRAIVHRSMTPMTARIAVRLAKLFPH
jgi:hypothetical protein